MRRLLRASRAQTPGLPPDLGIADYRPRFSPVVRALVALGPLSIRDLAGAIGVTHSAASQTVAQMVRAGLLILEPGADARQRIARLTTRARDLLPLIEAEWAATDAASAELEAELPAAFSEILLLTERAVVSRPMRARIADAARALYAALPAHEPEDESGATPTPAAGAVSAAHASSAAAGDAVPAPGAVPGPDAVPAAETEARAARRAALLAIAGGAE